MKKSELQQMIRVEVKKLLIEGEDKCEEMFGRWLFGEYKKFYGTIKEPNTKVETEIFQSLVDWIISAGRRAKTYKNLKLLLQCKEKYSKVLDQTKKTFYRVAILPPDNKITKGIKHSVYEAYKYRENKEEYRKYFSKSENLENFLEYCNKKTSYIPHKKIESWTTSKSSALKFAMTANHVPMSLQHHYSTVIIKANLSKAELLFNPKFTNIVATSAGWWPQNEVIRLSTSLSSINVTVFPPNFLPQSGELNWFRFPSDVRKIVVNEIRKRWSSF